MYIKKEAAINSRFKVLSALVKIVAQGGDSDFYAAKLRQLSEQKMDLTSQLQEIQKKKIENQALEYQYQQALIYINNEEGQDEIAAKNFLFHHQFVCENWWPIDKNLVPNDWYEIQ